MLYFDLLLNVWNAVSDVCLISIQTLSVFAYNAVSPALYVKIILLAHILFEFETPDMEFQWSSGCHKFLYRCSINFAGTWRAV
jgi:hypothetical protein